MSDGQPELSHALDHVYGAAPAGVLHKLKGEASTRRYYRFVVQAPALLGAGQPASLIVMQLSSAADAREAGRAQAHAFLDVAHHLQAQGIAVPRVFATDLERDVLLLEDLSDHTFEQRLLQEGEAAWPALYEQAIDLLADIHARCAPPRDAAECIAYRRTFDTALLRWELEHFREYGLEACEGTLAPQARAELDRTFDALTASIVALAPGFVHRDYQSRNLMWAPDGRLVVIDFQDAFIGPAPYDLVALLCDSYVAISPELQHEMLERYAQRRGYSKPKLQALVHGFRLIAVQRKLKDAGRFVFIDRVRGNPDFLPYFRRSLQYAERALCELPELSDLRTLLHRHMPGFPERDAPAAQSSR